MSGEDTVGLFQGDAPAMYKDETEWKVGAKFFIPEGSVD